jgi:hypothetical protein
MAKDCCLVRISSPNSGSIFHCNVYNFYNIVVDNMSAGEACREVMSEGERYGVLVKLIGKCDGSI